MQLQDVLDLALPDVAHVLQRDQFIDFAGAPEVVVQRIRADLNERLVLRDEESLERPVEDDSVGIGHRHDAVVANLVVEHVQLAHLHELFVDDWAVLVERIEAEVHVADHVRLRLRGHDLVDYLVAAALHRPRRRRDRLHDLLHARMRDAGKVAVKLRLGDVVPVAERLLPIKAAHVLAQHTEIVRLNAERFDLR